MNAVLRATYSALTVEKAISICSLLIQKMEQLATRITKLVQLFTKIGVVRVVIVNINQQNQHGKEIKVQVVDWIQDETFIHCSFELASNLFSVVSCQFFGTKVLQVHW